VTPGQVAKELLELLELEYDKLDPVGQRIVANRLLERLAGWIPPRRDEPPIKPMETMDAFRFGAETIVERTSTSMKRHQANGRRMGRPDRCPYGWQVDPDDPHRLIASPDEQAVIQRILTLHSGGSTSRGICATLDQEGLARRGGKLWSNAHRLVGIIVNRALYQNGNGRKS